MKVKVIFLSVVVVVFGLTWLSTWTLPTRNNLYPSNDNQNRDIVCEGRVQVRNGARIEVAADMLGRVTHCFVRESSIVYKGQRVLQLESRLQTLELERAERQLEVVEARLREVKSGARPEELKAADAEVQAAAADLENAKRALVRHEELAGDDVISQSALDARRRDAQVAASRLIEAEQRRGLVGQGAKQETIEVYQRSVEEASAAVESARELVRRTTILAPSSGTVIEKKVVEGMVISPSSPLLVIANLSFLEVNAEVDEVDITRIHAGQRAEISTDAIPGNIFEGRVHEIAYYAGARRMVPSDPGRNLDVSVVQVRIRLDQWPSFPLGMTVNVRIKAGER
jgi:multidrug resistance efflux pump